ncbi:MAG: DUF4214 domain-containing protein [Opitutaceae bacterium]|nr:DUF4214 domain-containing protein [Opitutaceae bacterium]
MKTSTRFALWLAAIVTLALGFARAQTPANLSPDRVVFFTEPNYGGESLIVEAGASVENLERLMRPSNLPWAFAISSAKIEGAARATVFSSPGFSGERLEITRSIPDLYGERRGRDTGATWDRAIVSVAVAGPPRPVAPAPVVVPPGRGEPPPTVIIVQPPPPPPVIVQPVRPRIDRRAAEAIVHRAFREVLDRPADPEGLRTYTDRLIREGWSEQQMIQQLQRSSEARGINADQAIAKIYREVLGREPDPRGLAHYRSKWKDGWTQGQIRDDLRRSAEGRDTYIRQAITRAYREVLGREPDPGGYATYEKAMRERGYTEQQVRAALMSGDEYRQRRGKK